jgi:TPP-dependent pyruvate/acetoin dehydrogenase alpha subunit
MAMVRIRRFEERVAQLFQAGLVKGTAQSYAGEEAIAVGACAHLREDDTIVASVERTNRLVVVHEGRKFGGFGGEIAAAVKGLFAD